MNQLISLISASLVLIATNPTSTTYLALAAVHLVIARVYLAHANRHMLALCAALTAMLYFVLALIHIAQ